LLLVREQQKQGDRKKQGQERALAAFGRTILFSDVEAYSVAV
jgi:hypothetical protein